MLTRDDNLKPLPTSFYKIIHAFKGLRFNLQITNISNEFPEWRKGVEFQWWSVGDENFVPILVRVSKRLNGRLDC